MRDPKALTKAAARLMTDPETAEIGADLALEALRSLVDAWATPRIPKGGKQGRRGDSLTMRHGKRMTEAMLRADVVALRTAIKGGPVPSDLFANHLPRERRKVDLRAVVSWARAERARERENRENASPEVPHHTPTEWACRAYLRAAGLPSPWRSALSLADRFEKAPRELEILTKFPK